MYKLIAIDMDGTLLKDDKTISEENKIAIKKAKDKGVKVVLSTGRPLEGIKKYLKQLDLISNHDYAVAFNGGLVEKTSEDEILTENYMTKEDLNLLYDLSKDLDIDIHFLTIDKCYTPKLNSYSKMESDLNGISLNVVDFNKLDENIKIIKIMFIGAEKKLDEIITKLPEFLYNKYNIVRTDAVYLEFLNKDVSKGYGVKKLAEKLGIKQDEVMCIGDAENDIHMVEYAGLGVAMGNAFPQLKKVANYITKTNEEHGVAHVIEKFVL
ncbi:sugar-phosphatase [Clostridium niameyense]|uniref:Sugar-phosphatase n=1 Tax=Clostridium niameyense TaxID=1622073 RepID=A0A6M0R943_9CLOT|nr:sugar-phosphatase [Clostridium niameyense]NEZ46772.1 sugar-phosphatase [Clostridium niameyense]